MHRKEENHWFCHQVITGMVFWRPTVTITSHTWPMIRDQTIANLGLMINQMNPTTANSSKTCDQEVFSPGEPLDAWHWPKIWIQYLANIWAAWCRGCFKCFQFFCHKMQETGSSLISGSICRFLWQAAAKRQFLEGSSLKHVRQLSSQRTAA